ncbi:MAG: hypothetical protein K2V38_24460, partial [Gemmataceae bacterium]|nr:hypothetical protein [Gemmataceae bacterium]
MADATPPAGLLDRAGHVFFLADQLGRSFQNEHQRQGEQNLIDPAAWHRLRPDVEELGAAVLELREVIQNPPDGFAVVAAALREAAQLVRAIRDTVQKPECLAEATYLDFFPSLNAVAASGRDAVAQSRKAEARDPTRVEQRNPLRQLIAKRQAEQERDAAGDEIGVERERLWQSLLVAPVTAFAPRWSDGWRQFAADIRAGDLTRAAGAFV